MYGSQRRFECLYKEPFMTMNFDESTFQVDGYDLAIVWYAQALHWQTGTDAEKAATLAPIYKAKGDELVRKRIGDTIQTRELVVQFGEPRFDAARLRNLRRNRYNNYAGH